MSPNFYNQKLGVSPIHVAANEGESEKVDILVKNKAEVNVVNAEGLSGMFTNTTSIEKVCRSTKGCEKSFAMKCFVFL